MPGYLLSFVLGVVPCTDLTMCPDWSRTPFWGVSRLFVQRVPIQTGLVVFDYSFLFPSVLSSILFMCSQDCPSITAYRQTRCALSCAVRPAPNSSGDMLQSEALESVCRHHPARPDWRPWLGQKDITFQTGQESRCGKKQFKEMELGRLSGWWPCYRKAPNAPRALFSRGYSGFRLKSGTIHQHRNG